MMISRMALRNIGRHRMRSVLSFVAIALGVFVVIMTKSFVDGTLDTFTRNTIELTAGHVRVTDTEYPPKERLMTLNYPVDGFDGEGVSHMVEKFKSVPEVKLVSPRIKFAAMASKGEDLVGMSALGVDPTTEMEFAHISRYLAEGRFIQPGAEEVVMGFGLLNKLGMKVGDRVTLVFSDSFGSMKGYSFDIVGELQSGLTMMDSHLVYLPLDTAQRMLAMPDMATEILLLAHKDSQVQTMTSQIQDIIKASNAAQRYDAVPWYSHNEMISYMNAAKSAYNFIYLFILFLASFVVINTMIMVVNERTKEIGMLSALGLRPKQIHNLFLWEGLILGVTGSAIGTILGGAVTKLLSVTGIQFGGIEAVGEEFLLAPTIYPAFNIGLLAYAFLAGLLVTAVAVYLPSRQAARLNPTEALRV